MKKLLILGGLAALLPAFAFAAHVGVGDNVVAPTPTEAQNLYLVGGTVNVSNNVKGDALLAGGTIVVSGDVEKDLFAVGGNMSMIGGTTEDLRVAGGNITIGRKISGEAMIAGGQIIITSATEIKGDSYMAGGTVNFSGSEAGNLVLAGGQIRIDGTINGNLTIKRAEKVTFGSQAVLNGKVEYSAPTEAVVESGAKLANTPVFHKIELNRTSQAGATKGIFAALGVIALLKILASLAAAYIIWYFFKKYSASAIENGNQKFWKMLLRGFAILVLMPIASIILLFTVIGWVPAVVMIVGYIGFLILATPISIIVASSLLKKLFKKDHTHLTWYQIIFGLVALRIVAMIPVVGWLACFAIYLVSLGIVATSVKERLAE